MPVVVRRVISWAVTIAFVFAAWSGLASLPGSAGIEDEVRWVLAHRPPAAGFNRIHELMRSAEGSRRGARTAILRGLLLSGDEQLVDAGLTLLVDLGKHSYQYEVRDDPFELFRSWYRDASSDEKLRHIPPIASLAILVGIGRSMAGGPQLPQKDDDLRWVIASTVSRSSDVWTFAWFCMQPRREARIALGRVQALDGLKPWVDDVRPETAEVDTSRVFEWTPIAVDDTFPSIAELLNDSNSQVRIGAGRILAVCRDARGLAAVDEWLRSDAKAPKAAFKVMEELFGVDWRKGVEAAVSSR